MKSLYKYMPLMLTLAMSFMSSCSSDEPFSVAAPTDEPHILDPLFPDKVNGQLPVVSNINRDANFKMTVTVTPSQSTEVLWFIDGEQVASGTTIDMPLLAGTYNMKVTATTTEGKSTYREGIVNVNALQDDPWSSAMSFERIVAPGSNATIYGSNLSGVKSLLIGKAEVSEITYDAEAGAIHYTVPADIANGTYRLALVDGEGAQYGANTVTVSASPLITSGADRMTSGTTVTLTGINLDKVATLTLGSEEMKIVSQSAGELLAECPSFEDGEYVLTGTSTDGTVQFFVNGALADQATIVVSSERTLWAGHHYVSWDLADDNPNKTFNLIGADVFASIKPGSLMTIHYSVEPSAEYHQIRTTTGWWNDLPGTAVVEFHENGKLEVVLTAEALDMIAQQAGFLCVGHGYFVDLVTLR